MLTLHKNFKCSKIWFEFRPVRERNGTLGLDVSFFMTGIVLIQKLVTTEIFRLMTRLHALILIRSILLNLCSIRCGIPGKSEAKHIETLF
jgi:hypothetical protein